MRSERKKGQSDAITELEVKEFMKGIELTRAGGEKDPVWIPLNSIVLVWPYNGFDGKKSGSEIALCNNGSVHVAESYVKIVELLAD